MKRKVLDKHLPPAVCTSEMLKQLKQVADREETSVSAVMRHAIAIFLANEDSKTSQKIVNQELKEV